MRAWKPILLVLGLLLAGVQETAAQLENETTRWLYQQLTGPWRMGHSKAAPVPTPGKAVCETSFTHQGAGVFRVHSSEPNPVLTRWNGRQVRVTGPISTDAQGWTYFQMAQQPCRIGRKRDGRRVLELNFSDRTLCIELVQG